jgi:disulfide bond formation protein DsbB
MSKKYFMLVGTLSALTLAIVYASEHWGGLVPCPLCLWERLPYSVALVMAVIGLLFTSQARLIMMGLVVIFTVSTALGVFHAGVEWDWWEGLQGCSSTVKTGLGLEDLRAALLNTPPAPCDKATWSFLGLSMAGYNAMLSFGLMIFTGVSVVIMGAKKGA